MIQLLASLGTGADLAGLAASGSGSGSAGSGPGPGLVALAAGKESGDRDLINNWTNYLINCFKI